MRTGTEKSTQERWCQLHRLGDALIKLPTVFAQVEFIQREFGKLIGNGTQVCLYLSNDYKPLPHQSGNLDSQVYFFDPSNCQKEVQADLENGTEDLSIPLVTSGESIGNMVLSPAPGFKPGDGLESFLDAAGSYLAGILELSRLSRVKEWRDEQLNLVRTVNSEIVQLRGTRDLFPRIAQLIQSTFSFFFVAIYTADEVTQKITYQSSAGRILTADQLQALAGTDGIAYGEGLVGACVQNECEIYAPDVADDERYRNVSGLEAARSELCLPLMIGERVLGVLEILCDTPGGLHQNDILVLKILSDNVALAVHNLGLIDDLLEQTWVSTMLLQVSQAAQQYDCTEDLLAAVSRIITLFTEVECCAIYLRNTNGTDFFLNAHYGFEKEDEPALAMLPYGMTGYELFNRLLDEKSPVAFDSNILKNTHNRNTYAAQRCGLVPLTAQGRVFGAILIDDIGRDFTVGESVISTSDALMAVARQTALAVENMRLQEAQENEVYVTAVLLQVAEMVSTASDLQETLDSIINFLPLVVGVDTAFIYLLDEGQHRLHLGPKLSFKWEHQLNRLPSSIRNFPKTNFGEMLKWNGPLVFKPEGGSIESWLKVEAANSLPEEERATISEPLLVVMPLYTHEVRYGLLFILESEKGFEYREKKIEIISGIGRNLSMALQNEKLKIERINRERINQEFALAQDIQRTFLPETLPEVPGWEIKVRWRPALQIGGDFYDAFALDDDRLGLVIADVSDKGFPAALYMTVARTLIHAEAFEGDMPSKVLSRVNRSLLLNSQKGFFISCVYAVLNTRNGEMVYTNAGHNRPLWLRKSIGEVAWLEKGGMPLGVSEELSLSDLPIQIKERDQLVFYTDGVTEARAVDEALFGEDRLLNILNHFRNRPSSSLIDTIDQKILDFSGGTQASDDLTLMVVKRLDNPTPINLTF